MIRDRREKLIDRGERERGCTCDWNSNGRIRLGIKGRGEGKMGKKKKK